MSSGILTIDISDHFPVFVFFGKKQVARGKTVTFQCKRISEEATNNIKIILRATDWSILMHLPVDEQFELFNRKLNEYISECSPIKTITVRFRYIMREKWMTKGLLRSSLDLHKLRRKMTAKCNADDMSQNYRSIRNLYNRLIRITKAKYFSELIEIYRNNIYKTWGVLKSIIGTNNDKTNCIIFKIDGAFTDDDREVSQSFCSYFTNIGQQCATSIGPSTKRFETFLNGSYQNSLFMHPSIPNDIPTFINNLKSQRSCGHDELSSKFIKDIKHEIAIPLCMLINKSIESGIVPDKLKLAKIVPIFKAKEQHFISNYRPISLLPVFSKILERVVHKNLFSFLTRNKILFPSQYGGMKGHSTVTAVTELITNILKAK